MTTVARKLVTGSCLLFCLFVFVFFTGKETFAYHVRLRIDVSSLHIYSMLNDMKEITIKLASQQALDSQAATKTNTSTKQAVTKPITTKPTTTPLGLIERTIKLLHEIVNAFNVDDDVVAQKNQFKILGIQYKFINICNLLKDVTSIGPRHIRMLKKKIAAFDKDIQARSLKVKDCLNKHELELLNKLTQFNQLLLVLLAHGEYQCFGFDDKMLDCFWYHPWEFVNDHPVITVSLVLAAGLFAWYYYIEPRVQDWRLENTNKNIDAIQFGVRTQLQMTCGVHGSHNLACMARGGTVGDIRRRLADGDSFTHTMQTNTRVNGTNTNLNGDHVARLVNELDLPEEARNNFVILESSGRFQENFLEDLNETASQVTWEIASAIPWLANLPDAPQRFHAGHTQYFLVNDRGHWLPFAFIPDRSARGGARVLTADSWFNRNQTNHRAVNSIHRFLTGAHPEPQDN